MWACWSLSGKPQVSFPTMGPLTLVNAVGGEKHLMPIDGRIDVTLGETPVYVVAAKSDLVAGVKEQPRPDRIHADSLHDFAQEQDVKGWRYGYIVSANGKPYDPKAVEWMKWEEGADSALAWRGPKGYSNLVIAEGGTHPSAGKGNPVWTVRRWTSDVDGELHLVAKASRTSTQGDGTECKVFVDGIEVYSKLLAPGGKETVDQNITVQKGSRVDFVITPGPKADTNFDHTGLRITLLAPAAK
jgi:hypothetical protein